MQEKLIYTPEFNKLSIKEQALLDRLIDSLRKFVRKTPELNRVPYKTRDAHATTYDILHGKFFVNEGFEQHSLFPNNVLDATLRISNAHMKIVKKGLPAYGFSLKLTHEDKTAANFPLVNFPLFPFNNVSKFLKLFTALNDYYTRDIIKKFTSALSITARIISTLPSVLHPNFLKNVMHLVKKRNDSLFTFTYHSIGAYRMGNNIVKLKLVPELSTELPDQISAETMLLKHGQYVMNLYIQYAYNLKDQPINILHREWTNSPFVPIGKFIFTSVADKNDRNLEQLSFDPFKSLNVFQPVGRIQQLRKRAYEASLEERIR